MASIKCRHCSKIYRIIGKITKHFSICKVRRGTTYFTVPCNTLHKTNNFSIAKTEAILPLVKPFNEKKSLYTDTYDKRNPADINKKMPNKNEVAKMPEVKLIIFESKYTIFTWSRLWI